MMRVVRGSRRLATEKGGGLISEFGIRIKNFSAGMLY